MNWPSMLLTMMLFLILQYCYNGMGLNNNQLFIFKNKLTSRYNWVRDELTFNDSDNDVAPDDPIWQPVSLKIPTQFNICTTFHFSYNPLQLLKSVISTKMEMRNNSVITHFNQMARKKTVQIKYQCCFEQHITRKRSSHSKHRLIER